MIPPKFTLENVSVYSTSCRGMDTPRHNLLCLESLIQEEWGLPNHGINGALHSCVPKPIYNLVPPPGHVKSGWYWGQEVGRGKAVKSHFSKVGIADCPVLAVALTQDSHAQCTPPLPPALTFFLPHPHPPFYHDFLSAGVNTLRHALLRVLLEEQNWVFPLQLI